MAHILPPLNRANANVADSVLPRILQFGGGNFMRAFTGWMIQKLNEEADFGGGIVLVKPTPSGSYDALRAQDGLYHVVSQGFQKGAKISEYKLIANISEIVNPYDNWEAFLESASIPSIRFIFSNTTESGIQFNSADAWGDKSPLEFPAKLTRWLYQRYQHFQGDFAKGCYILPCELIEENATTLLKCVEQYIDLWKLPVEFTKWLNEANFFCNTLVDRIVTGFPIESKDELFNAIGYQDQKLVATEPYYLWAVEEKGQLSQELPLGKIGLNVIFTDDIRPYRQLKVRILNGLHTAMVPVGYLIGVRTVKEAIEDDVISNYLRSLLEKEILPTLDFPPETLNKYATDIFDRFRNPFIRHVLLDISLNSTSKFKARLLPTLLAYSEQLKNTPDHIALALAALICFYRGEYQGEKIERKDSKLTLHFFDEIWTAQTKGQLSPSQLTLTVLANSGLWGEDLNKVPGFSKAVSLYLDQFLDLGHRQVIQQFLSEEGS